MERFKELNNENNTCMLINPEHNYLYNSFNKLLPQNPIEIRNQRAKMENNIQNSTDDTKINANTNLNSSYQKTTSMFNESNYDSNSQTDRSSNNIKEIKVNIGNKEKKSLLYDDNSNNYLLNSQILYENNLDKILLIQIWWKNIYKIILIQKYVRGYLFRINMVNIIYFIRCCFKLFFKIMMNKIKRYVKGSDINYSKIDVFNSTEMKDNKKIKKKESNQKFSKDKKLKNHPSFNRTNNFTTNKKIDEIQKSKNKKCKNIVVEKFRTNNPINNPINVNVNKSNNKLIPIKPNNNKYLIKNKNNKINKNKKEQEKEKKEIISNILNKDKIIANNIFNIYNNVKKFYEKENNNNSSNYYDLNNSSGSNFFAKNPTKKNVNKKSNNKMKLNKKGSMKNINKNNIINKNNNRNLNININSESKTDRSSSCSPKDKEISSILYLLKLKKAFLFWSSYTSKKKIIQKLKIIKKFETPYNNQKTLSIYSQNKNGQGKTSSIKTKTINLSNSLINIKNNKISPQKITIKNNSSRPNIVNNNYTKKHSNSVENNNSTINTKPPKPELNSSFNYEKQKSLEKNNNKNSFKNMSLNNKVIVVSQYDRKKDTMNNNNNINSNNNANEEKKIYYFYAIINLIDKHSKRKRIKKSFNIWKSLIRYNRTFINSFGIEEKIISFKSLKQPFKNNNKTKETKFNKSKLLFQRNNPGLSNCQTEAGCDDQFSNEQENQKSIKKDLYAQNPLEKSVHQNFFKSNNNKSKIVYQKKLLIQKKFRNQSMNTIHYEGEEDTNNNTIIENNKEMNYFSKSPENTFYNMNSHINYNNLNNSDFFNRSNNFDKNIGNIGRINKLNVKGIEETEVFFNPQVHTVKNSFIVRNKKINEDNGFNSNTINVNIIENYRKIDLKKDNINNMFNNNDKKEITIKKIKIKEGNKKIKKNSHSKEIKNDN